MGRRAFGFVLSISLAASPGCYSSNPLPQSVSCGALAGLHLGASRAEVETTLGRPPGGVHVNDISRRDADEYWRYAYADAGQGGDMDEWDSLNAYFRQGRLVFVGAQRMLADRDNRPAYRLFAGADGRERREYGPAFEQVFQCEPGFVRPTADADR